MQLGILSAISDQFESNASIKDSAEKVDIHIGGHTVLSGHIVVDLQVSLFADYRQDWLEDVRYELCCLEVHTNREGGAITVELLTS